MTHTRTLFLQYLKEVKQSPQNTLLAYERDLRHFADFLATCAITDAARVNKTNVMAYVLHMEKEGKQTATINRNMATIRTYFHYLFHKGVVPADPTFAMYTMDKVAKRPPNPLTEDEWQRLLAQPDTNTPKGARDHAILSLLQNTCVKASDVLTLTMDDVHGDAGYITCGARAQAVALDKPTAALLARYIGATRPHLLPTDAPTALLFPNLHGTPLTRQWLWKRVSAYGKQANIAAPVTPHRLQSPTQ